MEEYQLFRKFQLEKTYKPIPQATLTFKESLQNRAASLDLACRATSLRMKDMTVTSTSQRQSLQPPHHWPTVC